MMMPTPDSPFPCSIVTRRRRLPCWTAWIWTRTSPARRRWPESSGSRTTTSRGTSRGGRRPNRSYGPSSTSRIPLRQPRCVPVPTHPSPSSSPPCLSYIAAGRDTRISCYRGYYFDIASLHRLSSPLIASCLYRRLLSTRVTAKRCVMALRFVLLPHPLLSCFPLCLIDLFVPL